MRSLKRIQDKCDLPRATYVRCALGICLLMTAGCALPDRSLSRSENTESGPNWVTSAFANSRVSFKPPAQRNPTNANDADSSTPAPDARIVANADRSTATTSDSAAIQAGHSIDSENEAGTTGSRFSKANGIRNSNNVGRSNARQLQLTANSQIDQNFPGSSRLGAQRSENSSLPASDSFAQLGGVEFDDSNAPKQSPMIGGSLADVDSGISDPYGEHPNDHGATNVPNWAERQADENIERPGKKRAPGKTDSVTAPQSSRTEARPDIPSPNPAEQLPPLPWQAELDKLIVRVEQDLARTNTDRSGNTSPEYLRRQAQLRLLYLMSQRQQEALTAIPGIEPSQQEYWQHILLAMSNSFDTAKFPDSSFRAAQTVTPLSAALREIRDSAPLAIKNMGFCRKISYFGNYERFPRNEFTPGQEVLLYTEIENFVSTPSPDGEYRTSLKSLVEIVDLQGKVVWTKTFAPTEDFCRNPRRDYFHNYQFHIPKDLSTGTYSLKLTIEDELGHKRNSNSLNFVLK